MSSLAMLGLLLVVHFLSISIFSVVVLIRLSIFLALSTILHFASGVIIRKRTILMVRGCCHSDRTMLPSFLCAFSFALFVFLVSAFARFLSLLFLGVLCFVATVGVVFLEGTGGACPVAAPISTTPLSPCYGCCLCSCSCNCFKMF